MTLAAADFSQIPMSQNLAATLARASDAAGAIGSPEVGLEHLLLSLCHDPEAEAVLLASRVDVGRLQAETAQYLGAQPHQPPVGGLVVAPALTRILEAAAAAARGSRRRDINGAIVLAAIVGDGKSVAAQILQAHGLTFDEAIRALQAALAAPGREGLPDMRPADDVLARARERVQSRSAPSLRDIMADRPRAALPPPVQQADGPDAGQHFENPVEFEAAQHGTEPPRSIEPVQSPELTVPNVTAPEEPPRAQPADSSYVYPAGQPMLPQAPSVPSGPALERSVNFDLSRPAPVATPPPIPPPMPAQIAPEPQAYGATQLPHGRSQLPPMYPPQPPVHPGMRWESAGMAPHGQVHSQGQHIPQYPPQGGTGHGHSAPPPAPSLSGPAMSGARSGAPSPDGARARAKPKSEAGQLAENIPRAMRVGNTERIEIRIAKASVKALTDGLEGGGVAWRHDVTVTQAMSVRLRAPDGGFFIETVSPETQWIENHLGFASDDFASWRFLVTPQARGWANLQIVVSARTIGADGLAAETAMPDQVVEVKVRTNYKRTFLRWTGWILAAIAGGALAKFGEGGLDAVIGIVRKLIG